MLNRMRELQRQRSWREADVARTIQVYIKGPVARYRCIHAATTLLPRNPTNFPSTALVFNTLQHFFWDIIDKNLTKRVREKMLAAVLKNEMAWFDQEENESARIAARLALDANNVRSAIGDRISIIVQNTAPMLVACTAGFVLQWRLALVLIAVFPVVVAATVLQKMFMTGFSGDLEAAHAKATQLAGEAIANVRTVAAFNSEAKKLFAFLLPVLKLRYKGAFGRDRFLEADME
ncbi:Multidrug resistance protein 1 [Lathyrus oleraceus]|uniref:Multidrug resistance protein 1 n=1 Tax=Pisum sativum TaxID=3888 RepID=A0A9D4WF96_PEA|nr:Multidrug resistance protein 1 [Pisum sativum]